MEDVQRQARIPMKLQRRAIALLNQQCWLWGCDVRRPEGNLLLARGFSRQRAPDGSKDSSQYTLKLGGERIVRLWGFGLFYGATEGIYLNRYAFLPRVAAIAQEGYKKAAELGDLPITTDVFLLIKAMEWIGEYESWVMSQEGVKYRDGCLSLWKTRCTTGKEVADSWKGLAREIDARAVTRRAVKLGPRVVMHSRIDALAVVHVSCKGIA